MQQGLRPSGSKRLPHRRVCRSCTRRHMRGSRHQHTTQSRSQTQSWKVTTKRLQHASLHSRGRSMHSRRHQSQSKGLGCSQSQPWSLSQGQGRMMTRLPRESAGRGCAAWQGPRPAAARRMQAPQTTTQMLGCPAILMLRRSDPLSSVCYSCGSKVSTAPSPHRHSILHEADPTTHARSKDSCALTSKNGGICCWHSGWVVSLTCSMHPGT